MNRINRRDLQTMAVVIITLLVTLARSLRLPNEFAMTHWLFDYRFGFMKRALVGSICALGSWLLGSSLSAPAIVVLSSALMVVFLVTMLAILRQAMSPFRNDPEGLSVALVIVSSPFIVLSAHLIGYFDGLIYLIAALAIATALGDRPGLSGLVSVIGVLTHESYVVVGLPLVALASYQGRRSSAPASTRRHCWLVLLPPLIAFGLLSAAVEWGNPAELRDHWTRHLAAFEFVKNRGPRTLELNTTSFSQFWDSGFRLFYRRLVDSALLGTSLPTLLAVLLFAHTGYRVRPLSRSSLMILFTVLCPWLLHALAWDSARISAYPICGALLAIWILSRTRASAPIPSAVIPAALLAFLFNASSRTPLMDDQVEAFSIPMRAILYAPAALLLIRAFAESGRSSAPEELGTLKP